jgi:hypothetical protein
MDPDLAPLIVNIGVFVATAGAAAVAWWQAAEAARSRTDARDAQKAALTSWQEASAALVRANQISDRSLRAPFAYALNDLGSAVLSARMTGANDRTLLDIIIERGAGVGERAFTAGDVPTQDVSRWVSVFARTVDLGCPKSTDRLMEALQLIYTRVNLWIDDPHAVDKLVREDPRVEVDFS